MPHSYHDQYPDSPVTFLPLTENEKVKILNRIDQEWGCDEIIHDDEYYASGYGYCGTPEHDPFTNRCWDHTPGNLTSGHM